MAKAVYSTQVYALQDGTEIRLVPLAIGRLRRFMAAWSKFENIKEDANFEAFDIYVHACGIALENSLNEQFPKGKAFTGNEDGGEEITPEYKEYLEENLDMETIYKILEVCGGINLNDPKLLEAVERAQLDGLN